MTGTLTAQTAVRAPRRADDAALECLLFDFGGTLDCDGVAWKERFQGLYRGEGVELADPAWARIFYDADDPLVGALAAEVDLAETARRLVANIEAGLAGAGLGDGGARGARVVARLLDETETVVARNRMVLQALGRRYRLGIVSNFYGNLHGVCDGLGLSRFFGAMVDSEVVGARKPEPAIFKAAMGPLDAAPAATLMVGDSLHRDREGAILSGLDFIWIAPAEARPAAGAGGAGQRAIASLDGLMGMLL
ncbi:MAG TPA: HAD family hydrolase [Caulobacteraceae bacterium]|jgi:putative hydrolase of the HAD superfamily|nr:HAD family hydrolase [Caulobacteraceae bacterium]